VQTKLQGLVDRKIVDAQARVVELAQLTAELQQARAALGAHTPDGPCDDQCGCTTTTTSATLTEVRLGSKPRTASGPGFACTLAPSDMDARLAEWRAVLSPAPRRVTIDDGVRIEFDSHASISELARLAAAEQECCQFFRFSITVDERGVALEVRAPAEAYELVLAAFGSGE
jgi:hypothetical protein